MDSERGRCSGQFIVDMEGVRSDGNGRSELVDMTSVVMVVDGDFIMSWLSDWKDREGSMVHVSNQLDRRF